MKKSEREYNHRYYLAHRERELLRVKENDAKRSKADKLFVEHVLSCLPKNKFKDGRNIARQTKRVWSVKYREYLKLLHSGCHYCGVSLLTIGGHSLDRIDNSKGYTEDNVLPCCGRCNQTRGNRWTVQEMEVMIKAVLSYNREKQTNSKPRR